MNFDDTRSLGDLVRQTWKREGVTRKEVAPAAGTGLRFIRELENGKPTCHVGKVFDVLRSLGLQVRIERR